MSEQDTREAYYCTCSANGIWIHGAHAKDCRMSKPPSASGAGGEATPTEDELHSGDDDLLDALTGARVPLEELLEAEHGVLTADVREAVESSLQELSHADELRVAELRAAGAVEADRLAAALDEHKAEIRRLRQRIAEKDAELAALACVVPENGVNGATLLDRITALVAQWQTTRELIESWRAEVERANLRIADLERDEA